MRSAIVHGRRPFCVFWAFFGDLGATYSDHLRLIGKRVVEFLLVLIEVFFARCYSWGATSEYRFKIGDFALTGAGWHKISPRRSRSSPTILLLRKLNDLSYDIKIWTNQSFVLSQSTRLTDRRTERQTPLSSLVRAGILCSAENCVCFFYYKKTLKIF